MSAQFFARLSEAWIFGIFCLLSGLALQAGPLAQKGPPDETSGRPPATQRRSRQSASGPGVGAAAPNRLAANLKIAASPKGGAPLHRPPPNPPQSFRATMPAYRCFLGEFERPLYWGNLAALLLLHILAVGYFLYKLATFDAQHDPFLLAYAVLVGILGGLGITGGAHRYWTHRCFKATTPVKLLFLVLYSISGQNNLRDWVRDHRVHHKFSETDADPHNANRGFWFAHVGWLCMRKHPLVAQKGRTVDVSDITQDPLLAFHVRHWAWFKLAFCFVIPTLIPPLFFGQPASTTFWLVCIVRYASNLNFTWAVNSFAHIWGNKPYNRTIQPVENPYVSLVALGEGWHNYHHSFPWDYRAAELGRGLNLTTMCLDLLARAGLIYDLKATPPRMVQQLAKRRGDGSERPPAALFCE
ncbi:hypothetical protein YQE_06375, partial [Dendroctonus ponderosae]